MKNNQNPDNSNGSAPSPPKKSALSSSRPAAPAPGKKRRHGIYRQEAFDHLSSGGHIDELLRVSRPSDWIIIGTICAICALFIVWTVVGRIPSLYSGEGVIQPEKGIIQVVSTQGGVIRSSVPLNGSKVKKGGFLLRILTEQSDLDLVNQREITARAKVDYEVQQAIYDATVASSAGANRTTVKLMEENITALEKEYRAFQKDYQEAQGLFKQGYVTKNDLLSAQSDASSSWQSLHNARIQLAEKRVTDQAALILKETELRNTRQSYDAARDKLRQIESDREAAVINAPAAGIIRQAVLQPGDTVAPGAQVCLIEAAGPPVLTHLFISADEAKRIEVGAPVKLEVESYPPDKYGKLMGTVTAIDALPASQALITESAVYSASIAQKLIEGPPVIRVTVRLETEEKDGIVIYKKAGGGRAFIVSSGMVCTGSAVYQLEAPITLVIPALKKWFGATAF